MKISNGMGGMKQPSEKLDTAVNGVAMAPDGARSKVYRPPRAVP